MRTPFARFLLLGLLALAPGVALAQAPDIAQMFANFSESSVALMNMVRWAAFLIGIIISSIAIMKFKEHSESGGRVKLGTPIFLTVIGACLLAFPGSVSTVTETLALGSNSATELTRVPDGGGVPGMAAALAGILLFIKLIGHIAFVRGFLLLKNLAEGQQGAGLGRALTHIFGGAMAININATVGILAATFAPGMDLGV